MAPNVGSNEISTTTYEGNGKSREEIYYKGYFYDVTDFIHRHPGGNIIKFYTARGEDATQAIDQFHYRARNRVEAIMKSFKRRPAEEHERGLETKTLLRHEALDQDFKKLFKELEEEGYFKPSISHVVIRLLDAAALITLTIGIFFQCETVIAKLLSTFFVGFALSRLGWIQHEGGHRSLTGRAKIDRFIQDIATSFMLGGSSIWWNSQHNRHHAMPQRLEHDVDLSTLPYVAFHKRTVKDPSQINSFFIKYQSVFYWTLDLFVVTTAWRFVLHPRYQLKKGAYYEFLLGLPSLFFIMFVVGPIWYILSAYWFAFFLGINFALSHSHLEVADRPTHWIEYSLTHTANIKSSPLVDYFMGYLNFQIEHHLFPTMPQFRQKEIGPRVKALAEKHGLPYREYGYFEACALAMKNLHTVGQELTGNEYFSEKSD